MDKNQVAKIKDKIAHSGWGVYDTHQYRYDLDPQDRRLRRVSLDKLDTTAMLAPDAWEYLESKKPRTSTAVKRRYNDKTYDRLIADLRKEFVAEVREWAAAHNESIAGMIKAALTDYMKSRD